MPLRASWPGVSLFAALLFTAAPDPIRGEEVSGPFIFGTPQSQSLTVTLGNVPPAYQTAVPVTLPPPATVPPGATLVFRTGFSESTATSVEWFKDDQRLAVTASSTLEVAGVKPSDSGTYYAMVHSGAENVPTDRIAVRVMTALPVPLLNLSARATIGAGNRMLIGGFVVAPSAGKLKDTKTILIRAVGPSLIDYGVASPLAKPRVRLFDSAGKDITQLRELGYTPAVFAKAVGAFPLRSGSADYEKLFLLPPGGYSLQIDSVDGGEGTVLAEVYDVPAGAVYPWLPAQ